MKKNIFTLLLIINISYANSLFLSGDKTLGVTLGTDSSFESTYTVVGANVNYFIIDNLSIGASYQAFLGDTPTFNEVTVPVTYHLPLENTTYRPYIGAFYNQTFISDSSYKDYNVLGGRAGVSLQTSLNSFMSLGWVQEFSTSDKNRNKKGYPELKAGFKF